MSFSNPHPVIASLPVVPRQNPYVAPQPPPIFAPAVAPNSNVVIPAAEIHIGTPPKRSSDDRRSALFRFHFNNFDRADAAKVETPTFVCFDHEWKFRLHPKGKKDGKVSASLEHISACPVRVAYDVGVPAAKTFVPMGEFLDFGRDSQSKPVPLGKHADMVRSEGGVLQNGTLTVELFMRLDAENSPGCVHFIPSNPFDEQMRRLFLDEETADVCFEVSGRTTKTSPSKADSGIPTNEAAPVWEWKCNKCEVKNSMNEKECTSCKSPFRAGVTSLKVHAPVRFPAHRVILKMCAPTLYELCECESYSMTSPVPICGTDPDVFKQLLNYVYGRSTAKIDWEKYSKEMIDCADKFGVPSLKMEAEVWYLKYHKLTLENVVGTLLYADAKHCALLKEKATMFVLQNVHDILSSEYFGGMTQSESILREILMVGDIVRRGPSANDVTFKTLTIDDLRTRLHDKGLDFDGTREMLLSRLEKKSNESVSYSEV
ncbi:hypothetical protein ACHAW6_002306 [Cyclotella cf. meneghiniana]